MTDVLVILDGASEPIGDGPTSLERARTPTLDALVAAGKLSRVRTVARGLPAGSESAIPALLGWTPPAPVDRGAVEAAARELFLAPDERAWRIDVRAGDGGRASAAHTGATALELDALLPRHAVHTLGGHRLLAVGPAPLPACAGDDGRHVWPEGVVPPRVLDGDTVMVAARGAAAGIARLLGARVVIPPGATGRPGSDLAAKADAALRALAGGCARVVVHVGGPDEAAHELDGAAKVAALEAADRDLLAPLTAALRTRGGTLRVCPDHGCDPSTGRHDGAPVPCVTWRADIAPRPVRLPAAPAAAAAPPARAAALPPVRLTERSISQLPLQDVGAIDLASPDEASGEGVERAA